MVWLDFSFKKIDDYLESLLFSQLCIGRYQDKVKDLIQFSCPNVFLFDKLPTSKKFPPYQITSWDY